VLRSRVRSTGRAMLRWFSWSAVTLPVYKGGTSSLAPRQESELMVVARGVEEGAGWPHGHLAFQRVTGAEGDE